MVIHAHPEADARKRRLEELGDEIAALAAHIHAATYELLVLVEEFDREQGWEGGWKSCAQWLSWRTGIAPGASREKVRVARALPKLPQTSEALRRGELSYSKVRALSRIATPDNEGDLVTLAKHGTAAQIERIVRSVRQAGVGAEREQAQRQHDERYLRWHTDDHGMLVISGRLPPEVGAKVVAALEASADALREDERQGGEPPAVTIGVAQRFADALSVVADAAFGGGLASAPSAAAERTQVVLHVDADVLADPTAEGRSGLDGTQGARRAQTRTAKAPLISPGDLAVSAETARRLACDASTVTMVDGPNGEPLSVGRKTRKLNSAIRRALHQRDGGCQFPGCGHKRFVQAHHVRHWANGGQTKLSNLILLCSRHHFLVHEGGFDLRADERGAVTFYAPDGRPIVAAPHPPPVHGNAVALLREQHADQSIDIDAHTIGVWDGLPVDYGLAVDCVLGHGPPAGSSTG